MRAGPAQADIQILAFLPVELRERRVTAEVVGPVPACPTPAFFAQGARQQPYDAPAVVERVIGNFFRPKGKVLLQAHMALSRATDRRILLGLSMVHTRQDPACRTSGDNYRASGLRPCFR